MHGSCYEPQPVPEFLFVANVYHDTEIQLENMSRQSAGNKWILFIYGFSSQYRSAQKGMVHMEQYVGKGMGYRQSSACFMFYNPWFIFG